MGFRLHIPAGVLNSGDIVTDPDLLADLASPRMRIEVECSLTAVPAVDGTFPLWTLVQTAALWIRLALFRNAGVWRCLLTVQSQTGPGNYYSDPIDAPELGKVYRGELDLWPGEASVSLFDVTEGEFFRSLLQSGGWSVSKFFGQTYAIPPTAFNAGCDDLGGSTWGVQLSAVEVW